MTDSLPEPPKIDPAALAGSSFARSRRGFDTVEVNATLGRAADALRTWELRDRQLLARIDELERKLAEARELDEQRIASVLGEETARIITTAREAATEIRAKAAEEAEKLIADARSNADETVASAEAAAKATRADADEIRSTAQQAAERLISESKSTADQLVEAAEARSEELRSEAQARHDELIEAAAAVLEQRTKEAEETAAAMAAKSAAELADAETSAREIRESASKDAEEVLQAAREQGREMVAEAKAVRSRILDDLADRRNRARRQIEGARAGRDRIVEILNAAGSDIFAAVEALGSVEDEAQQAAQVAAGQLEDDSEDFLAGLELVELPQDDERAIGSATSSAERDEPMSNGVADKVADAAILDENVAKEPESVESAESGSTAEPVAEQLEQAATEARVQEDAAEEKTALEAQLPTTQEPERDPSVPTAAEPVALDKTVADSIAVETTAAELDVEEASDTSQEAVAEFASIEDSAEVYSSGQDSDEVGATVAHMPEVARVEDDDPAFESDDDGDDNSSVATVHDLFARIRAEGRDYETQPDAPSVVSGESEETSRNEELMDQRDSSLEPIEKQMLRALRRLATGEQNEVLDRLRRVKKGRPEVDEVLPGVEASVDEFCVALGDEFKAAVEAGAAFWSRLAGTSSDSLFTEDDRASGKLRTMVTEFLTVHRAHLERALTDADAAGLDTEELGETLRAAYKDWRSSSLSDLAGDLAIAAFAHGERSAAGPGTPWKWVVDHGGLPCADGEDNALAGAVSCGEKFPTGDITPPAHSGCRCILVPAHR